MKVEKSKKMPNDVKVSAKKTADKITVKETVKEAVKQEPAKKPLTVKVEKTEKTVAAKLETAAKVKTEAKVEEVKKAEKVVKTVKTEKKPRVKAVKKAEEGAKIEKTERKKSVMFVASEGLPFVKTGGLSDVIGSLPKSLAERGNYDVSVIMPLYGQTDGAIRSGLTFIGNFNVGLAWRNQYCGLFSCRLNGVTYYFIDNEYYFKRDNLYGYFDDGERFAFFSKAVLDSLGYLGYYPDVLNCNDWHTAATIIYLRALYGDKFGFDHIKTIFTIHNIEYQGKYGLETAGDLFGFPEWIKGSVEFDGCLNLMKGAIELADKVTTVSPTYAGEIKNQFFAHGLDSVINRNAGKLCGILNGIDEALNDPKTDSALFKSYSAADLSGKAVCKAELQKMLGLPVRADVPVIAMISRLVSHKGLDLVKRILDELLCEDVQFIILGKGDVDYENFFRYMEGRYNGKCRALIAFNRDMASKLYAGADIFLMPSKQEPCGLSQMIACRYGTIPVVRRTGGLADSIKPFNDDRTSGNGFAFSNYNAHEMLYVIKDSIFTFGNKEVWNTLVQTAMTTDFSWSKSAEKYEQLYNELLGL